MVTDFYQVSNSFSTTKIWYLFYWYVYPRSQVRDLLNPASVVRDFRVNSWHYSAILTERDDAVKGVFTCQRTSRIPVTRILPTRSVTKMVILLNEHSIFWSFLYARLVWCVPDAGSHQNIANFRLGKKSIERLIIYLKNKRKNRILRCTGIPKKKKEYKYIWKFDRFFSWIQKFEKRSFDNYNCEQVINQQI